MREVPNRAMERTAPDLIMSLFAVQPSSLGSDVCDLRLWLLSPTKRRALWVPRQTRIFFRSHLSVMHTATPNQSLQPTATRCTSIFFMIKTVPDIFSPAPGSRG